MWRWKALGYTAAIILFAIIFVKGAKDSGEIGLGFVCSLIAIAGFVGVAIYIHNNEHGK